MSTILNNMKGNIMTSKNTISIEPKAVDVLRFNHGIKYNQINLQYKTIMKINNGEEVRHSSMRKFYDLYNKYYPMDYLEFLEVGSRGYLKRFNKSHTSFYPDTKKEINYIYDRLLDFCETHQHDIQVVNMCYVLSKFLNDLAYDTAPDFTEASKVILLGFDDEQKQSLLKQLLEKK
tara:strand:+ start:1591 stop:2118 length:528 start_codon:yes stop_codon:yes gene_type:complete